MFGGKTKWAVAALSLALGFSLMFAPEAAAQKKKKNGEKEDSTPTIILPDPQQVETRISEMLAAWQIGDVTLLQKYFANDVTVVSSAYEPPLQGWTNYAAAYQRQRGRIESVRLDRRNTFVQVKGTLAWAIYQWEMQAMADGQPYGARGHTTLTFEKRGGAWVIVHNHTSIVSDSTQSKEKPPQPEPPGSNPQ